MRRTRVVTVAIFASISLHGLAGWMSALAGPGPSPTLALQQPVDIELGFVDDVDKSVATAPPAVSQPNPGRRNSTAPATAEHVPANAAAVTATGTRSKTKPRVDPDAGAPTRPVEPGRADGSRPAVATADAGAVSMDGGRAGADAGFDAPADAAGITVTSSDAALTARRAQYDAGAPAQDAGPTPLDASLVKLRDGSEGTPGRVPRRGQVSVRLNLGAMRASLHAELLTAVLARVPDVRALTAGSGVDPVQDLDLLWTATPDLSRHRAVIAGLHRRTPGFALAAARKMAARAGQPSPVRQQGALTTVAWHDPDPTVRVLSLLGKRAFIISRQADLPAVLRLAAVRAGVPANQLTPALLRRGLLAMSPGTLAELQVEGVSNYVQDQKSPPAPRRVQADVQQTPGGQTTVTVRASFSDAELAQAAANALRVQLRRYASHPIALVLGLSAILNHTQIVVKGQTSTVMIRLSATQTTAILSTLRDTLPRAAP